MNHEALYIRFIQSRRSKSVVGYSERHHIIPRCEGGSNHPENLIQLSARDHIFAHLILARWKGGVHWLSLKYTFSAIGRERRLPTAQEVRIAAKTREGVRAYMSEIMTGRPGPWTGKTLSPKHREAIGRGHLGSTRSAETRSKMAKAQIGKTHTAGTRTKLSAARKGKPLSAATKDKLRAINTGRRLSAKAIAKVKAARAKQKPPRLGMKASEETKSRMRATWARKREAAR